MISPWRMAQPENANNGRRAACFIYLERWTRINKNVLQKNISKICHDGIKIVVEFITINYSEGNNVFNVIINEHKMKKRSYTLLFHDSLYYKYKHNLIEMLFLVLLWS